MPHPSGRHGEVFLDARGHGRALRLTWHHEADVVVLSLWRDQVCAGTFRLSIDDVSAFVDTLVDGLRDAPGVSISRSAAAGREGDRYTRDQAAGALPPRQRTIGEPAAASPETVAQLQEDREPEQESFTDWAFGSGGRHRARAS